MAFRIGYPSRVKRSYLDHNATSPILPTVAAAMIEVLRERPANASSIHAEGRLARRRVEEARASVREALGGERGRWVWTSGATESNRIAILGAPAHLPIVTSRLEHASVRSLVESLAERGRVARFVPHDRRGRITADAVRETLAGEAALLALSVANNEIGNLLDTGAVLREAACVGARVHLDASQLAFRARWSVPPGVSSVAISFHKAGGPQGVGALWLSDEALVAGEPGGGQERGLRPGTEAVPAIAGAGALARHFSPAGWEAQGPVRDALERCLVERLGAVVHGDPEARLPNTTCVSIPGRVGEELLWALDLAGISASTGSACSLGAVDVSPVLLALTGDRALSRAALRFSLGPGDAESSTAPEQSELRERIVAALSRPSAVE